MVTLPTLPPSHTALVFIGNTTQRRRSRRILQTKRDEITSTVCFSHRHGAGAATGSAQIFISYKASMDRVEITVARHVRPKLFLYDKSHRYHDDPRRRRRAFLNIARVLQYTYPARRAEYTSKLIYYAKYVFSL